MATHTVFVDTDGEVKQGVAIPSSELSELVQFLHNEIDLCSDALKGEGSNGFDESGSGRRYRVGKYNEPENCELCNHYAARILAKYELKERA
jgi:hypothetical protein